MEQDGGSRETAAADVILRVAKTLQGSFFKQTTGNARKWRDVPPDEQTVWLRLSRTAAKILAEADVPADTSSPSPATASPPPAAAPISPNAAPVSIVTGKPIEPRQAPVPVEAKPPTPAPPAEKFTLARILEGAGRPLVRKK